MTGLAGIAPPPPFHQRPSDEIAHQQEEATAAAADILSASFSQVNPSSSFSTPAPAPAPTPATAPTAESSGDSTSAYKPKRVQNVSCDACRLRKVKCDRAPRIAEWRTANSHLPQAHDLAYRPGTEVVWCSLCSEHGIKCTLTIKPPKRRVGRRIAALKKANQDGGDERQGGNKEDRSSGSEHDEELLPRSHQAAGAGAEGRREQDRPRKRQRVSSSDAFNDDIDPSPSRSGPSATRSRLTNESQEVDLGTHSRSPPPSTSRTVQNNYTPISLSSPQIGIFGVPRLSKDVLDASIMGFFSGPCVCPSIVRYEEILPRYRAYFRKEWGSSNGSSQDRSPFQPYTDGFGLAASMGSHGLVEDSMVGDNLPRAPPMEECLKDRVPFSGDDIIPLPPILTIALALAGSGQLDQDVYPFKLHLQRDLAERWKEISEEYVSSVDLGLDFAGGGGGGREDEGVGCHEAQDALDAMIIVSAQDYEVMGAEHEVAMRALRQQAWNSAPGSSTAGGSAHGKEHIIHQTALLFQIRPSTLEGTLRLAYKMGINRNPFPHLTNDPSSSSQFPLRTSSLVTRIRRTREWWVLFANDAFESLARRTPLLIGDWDFDVALPSFRSGLGPNGEVRVVSGPSLASRTRSTPQQSADVNGNPTAPTSSSGPPKPNPSLLPTSFDVNWTNSLFSLVFLARGLSRRFVSVRAQGQGINVLDALNSIEVLERFYRGVPGELRWEYQDTRLLRILGEMYPSEPRTGGRESGVGRDGEGSDSTSSIRRRRVPNSVRATNKAFRDGIQSLTLESLLASVVICLSSAVDTFGFRNPGRGDDADPLAVVEAMLSGQLRENPFFRVDQDSASSEPRFLKNLKDDLLVGKSKNELAFEARKSASALVQHRSMEDVTVPRLYTLTLRFFFRMAKVFREAAQHDFLSPRYNTFGGVAAIYTLWGIKHVNDLMKAAAGGNDGTSSASPSTMPASNSGAHSQPGRSAGPRTFPGVCRMAATDTGTDVEDAKQAVRDLIDALASTITSDTRVEGLVRALRGQTQSWDEEEVWERQQHQQQSRHAGSGLGADGNADGFGAGVGVGPEPASVPPSSFLEPGPMPELESSSASSEWYKLAAAAAAAAAANTSPPQQQQQQMPQQPLPPPPPVLPTSSNIRPSGYVSLGLDPFADLSQFGVAYGGEGFEGNVPSALPPGTEATSGGAAMGYGVPQLPPIGHLSAGNDGMERTAASSTYDFDRAVREMLAAAAAVGGGPVSSSQMQMQGQRPHSVGGLAQGAYTTMAGSNSYGGSAEFGQGQGGGGQGMMNMLSPMTLALSTLPPLSTENQSSMDWLAGLM
ncbi:hypothetical protein A4X09_0g3756 [Tilletia walkeri]|uniref:Zn(2)-C6 fungal-type domain-containing protein n=1 Tax=Tilletia walkeri TaxID=117179 RepID=A0A8X7NAG3_9BASI|nr:hypothetical protein A4X09_0g3756 [Tilletia walkeri]